MGRPTTARQPGALRRAGMAELDGASPGPAGRPAVHRGQAGIGTRAPATHGGAGQARTSAPQARTAQASTRSKGGPQAAAADAKRAAIPARRGGAATGATRRTADCCAARHRFRSTSGCSRASSRSEGGATSRYATAFGRRAPEQSPSAVSVTVQAAARGGPGRAGRVHPGRRQRGRDQA